MDSWTFWFTTRVFKTIGSWQYSADVFWDYSSVQRTWFAAYHEKVCFSGNCQYTGKIWFYVWWAGRWQGPYGG